MRKLLLFPVLFVFMQSNSQPTNHIWEREVLYASLKKQSYKFKLKEHIAPALCLFISGAGDGLMDYLQFHYDGPNDWLNPDLSWRRKWKNGDKAQGERFPGSSTVFVGFTDAWHGLKMVRNTSFILGLTLKIGEKKKFKYYLYDFLIYYAVHKSGFAATYYTLK